MKLNVRTAACTALLLLVSTLSVFASASPLGIVIKPSSEQVQAIRYQTGNSEQGPWLKADPANPVLELNAFDIAKDKLFVQQSEDLKQWTDSYIYQYNQKTDTWDVSLPKAKQSLGLESMDAKLYGLLPIGSCSSSYSYAVGAALKLNLSFDDEAPVYGFIETAYSMGPSNSDWVDTMQAVNASIGLGYRFTVNQNMQLIPELGYGVALHLLHGDFDQDGTASLKAFADQQLRFSLNLSYALPTGHQLLIGPVAVVLFEQSGVACLAGLQTGLRFNF